MSKAEFIKKIAKSKDRYTFLLGNGLSLYMKGLETGKEQNGVWSLILQAVANKILLTTEAQSLSSAKGRSDFEKANLIHQLSGLNCARLECHIAEAIGENLKVLAWDRITAIPLLDYIWDKGHHILTTNFEDNIERYFFETKKVKIAPHIVKMVKSKSEKSGNEKSGKEHETPQKQTINTRERLNYRWNRYFSDQAISPVSVDFNGFGQNFGHDIWYLHGKMSQDNKKKREILFSFTDYILANNRFQHNYANNIGKNYNCLDLIFNCPLVIAGIGLTESEIFLRNLLMKRFIIYKKSKSKVDQSFYLCPKSGGEHSDGRDFLKCLGFEIVEFKEYSDIYTSFQS